MGQAPRSEERLQFETYLLRATVQLGRAVGFADSRGWEGFVIDLEMIQGELARLLDDSASNRLRHYPGREFLHLRGQTSLYDVDPEPPAAA